MKNKKLLLLIGAILAGGVLLSWIFSKYLTELDKPYAQVIDEDPIEECTEVECGDGDGTVDDEPIEEVPDEDPTPPSPTPPAPTPPSQITPPPSRATPPPAPVTPPPAVTPPPSQAIRRETPPGPGIVPPSPVRRDPGTNETGGGIDTFDPIFETGGGIDTFGTGGGIDTREAPLTQEERRVRQIVIQTTTRQVEAQIQEALNSAVQIRETAQQVSAFRSFAAQLQTGATSRTADINRNNLPDGLERDSGLDPTKVDEVAVRIEGDLAIMRGRFIAGGSGARDADAKIAVIRRRIREQRRRNLINSQAQARYRVSIKNSRMDSNGDGISDEVAVIRGLDPKGVNSEGVLYRASGQTSTQGCTLNLSSGDQVSGGGVAVLATCVQNGSYELVGIDVKGVVHVFGTAVTENKNMVFTVDASDLNLPAARGRRSLILQIRETEQGSTNLHNSVINSGDAGLSSDPVLVEIVSDSKLETPIVKTIGALEAESGVNLEEAGLSSVKIKIDSKSGKVKVKGVAPIDSTVISSFASAVYSGAILADLEGGSFESISPKSLSNGDHEVVLYADRPEDGIRSVPVKLRFTIVEKALATDGTHEAADEAQPNTLLIFAIGGGMVLLVGGAIALKRKKPVA